MNLAADHLVIQALQQQRHREAEQYRLMHPQQTKPPHRRSPHRRRRAWPHLPELSTLAHPGRRTPRALG